MGGLKVCLVIDTEADFWRYIPSPHFSKLDKIKWKFNKLFSNYRYANGRQGIVNIVRLLRQYKFPATFTIVGHLYLKSCNGFPHFGEKTPEGGWLGKKWNYWDPKTNFRKHPNFYLGDFIENEMKVSYFDLGLHAFSHEALTLEDNETINSCIKAAVKSALSCGVKPISFGAPFNMLEDINDPKKVYSAIKKNRLKIVRYAGKEDGFSQMHEAGIKKPFKKYGLKLIQVSHYFEGNSSKDLIKKILSEINNSIGKDVVYCLCTHDFTHKNTENLGIIIKKVLELEKQRKIKIVNMKQLLR